MFDACEIEVEGRPVRYRAIGSGPPLVLVHGLAGSWRWWRACMPALAERHTVVAVDLPGFGDLRGERFSLARAPDFLAAWMDALGLERPALVGHSMGGAICARVAAREPGRVGRLVLVAPAIGLRPSLFSYVVPLARALLQVRPRFAPTLALDAARSMVGVGEGAFELVADGALEDLEEVAAPTLVVWGRRDALLPAENAEAVEAHLPDARVHLIERAGHVPMVDAPAEFSRAVLEHLGPHSVEG